MDVPLSDPQFQAYRSDIATHWIEPERTANLLAPKGCDPLGKTRGPAEVGRKYPFPSLVRDVQCRSAIGVRGDVPWIVS